MLETGELCVPSRSFHPEILSSRSEKVPECRLVPGSEFKPTGNLESAASATTTLRKHRKSDIILPVTAQKCEICHAIQ